MTRNVNFDVGEYRDVSSSTHGVRGYGHLSRVPRARLINLFFSHVTISIPRQRFWKKTGAFPKRSFWEIFANGRERDERERGDLLEERQKEKERDSERERETEKYSEVPSLSPFLHVFVLFSRLTRLCSLPWWKRSVGCGVPVLRKTKKAKHFKLP